MRQCPVCDKYTSEVLCHVCGFDFSRDYEHNPTFAPTMSIAARRKAWQERLEANRQEQEWKAERNLTRVSLNAVENRCRQLTKENRELNDQLKDAQAHAAAIEAQKTPNKRKKEQGTKLWDRYLDFTLTPAATILESIETHLNQLGKNDSLIKDIQFFLLLIILPILATLCVTAPVLTAVYGLTALGHYSIFHVPQWSQAPCDPHVACFFYRCSLDEYHQWDDPSCLEPRTCTVC